MKGGPQSTSTRGGDSRGGGQTFASRRSLERRQRRTTSWLSAETHPRLWAQFERSRISDRRRHGSDYGVYGHARRGTTGLAGKAALGAPCERNGAAAALHPDRARRSVEP